jgi:putative spermidine/putrescine transport system permease protein
MRWNWNLLVIPPFVLSMTILVFTQLVFMEASFHRDLGLGRLEPEYSWANYLQVWSSPDYLDSLWLTIRLALSVVVVALLMTWPVAYLLSRIRPRTAMLLIAVIMASTFISLPIKALGLIILFGSDGFLMSGLRSIGLIAQDSRFVGSLFGVAVGYGHLAIGLMVIMLFSVMQAIPRNLEEAAMVHGASWLRMLWRIVIPLTLPGTISASLMLFNLLTGAFVSAALLGGGRILTLPVLIQQTLILFNEYGMAATLAAILLMLVLLVNVISVFAVSRLTRGAGVIT